MIILTAKTEEVDRVVGFELGADDYVTKPFSVRELILRVKAILKRRVDSPQQENDISDIEACFYIGDIIFLLRTINSSF